VDTYIRLTMIPTELTIDIDKRVDIILSNLQEELPLAPFIEGKPIGMLPIKNTPEDVLGITSKGYDSMMNSIWKKHNQMTEEKRSQGYSIKRTREGVDIVIRWAPDREAFFVRQARPK
jgi:hypothetical protein